MSRFRFEFWLDDTKPEERELMDHIRTLKDKQRFVSTIRTGLVLVPALEEGDHQLLQQKYPAVVEKLTIGQGCDEDEPPPAPPTAGADTSVILQGINELKEMMEHNQNPIPATNGRIMQAAEKPLQQQTGQLLTQKTFDIPIYDDEDIVIETHKDTHTDASTKFMEALHSLQ